MNELIDLITPKEKRATKVVGSTERQTIVHCYYDPVMAVRVWPSTFLIERESSKRIKLITAFNIAYAPDWTFGNENAVFTLVFGGLSKGCSMFDLVEDIPLPDPFVVKNIPRNKADVYEVNIS